jgi:hypothetical protein
MLMQQRLPAPTKNSLNPIQTSTFNTRVPTGHVCHEKQLRRTAFSALLDSYMSCPLPLNLKYFNVITGLPLLNHPL